MITLKGSINARRKLLGRMVDRRRLQNSTFTLFSNDCWGAEVYKHLELPFNTPFIGLMLQAPCYLKLLSNPKHYLAQPLVFRPESRYTAINEVQARWGHRFPIATLDNDVEIQFLHYHSEEEAQQKWSRRVERINWENLFLKFDGSKDAATPELIREFDKLPFPKLTLLREPLVGIASSVTVPNYSTNAVELFEQSLPVIDIVGWLNGGSAKPSSARTLYHKLVFPINK